MKIQVGQVKYKGRDDYRVVYGTTDDGRLYYFLDDVVLENGGRIASTELVEAIDNSVKPSHVGVVNNEGREIIPCNNKNVKLITNGILLVELSEPQSENVKNTNILRNDPAAATKLVSTPAAIKSKIGSVMSKEGRYVFNDLFSEAYICDLEANVLVDGLYSFVAVDPTNQKIYLSKNDVNDNVIEYSILPPQVQNDVTPSTDSNDIDVTEVAVPQDTVEDALNSSETSDNLNTVPDNEMSNVSSLTDEASNVQEEIVDNGDKTNDNSQEITIPQVNTVEESGSPVEDEVQSSDSLYAQEEANDVPMDEQVNVEKDSSVIPSVSDTTIDTENKEDTSTEVAIDNDESNESEDSSKKVIEESPVEEQVNVVEQKENSQPEDFEFNYEEKDDKEPKNDDNEKNKLEEMYDDSASEMGDIPNYSFDEFNESELDGMLDDDVFEDSEIKPDKIDTMDDFDINDININNSKPDNLIEDVAQSFKELMKSNREQRIVIAKYKEKIKKLTMTLNMVNEKKKAQAESFKELSKHYRELENDYTRCTTKVQLLESKVADQERIINSQERELTSIRPQLAGKEELAKLVTDARALLNSDSIDDDYYYRQAS